MLLRLTGFWDVKNRVCNSVFIYYFNDYELQISKRLFALHALMLAKVNF